MRDSDILQRVVGPCTGGRVREEAVRSMKKILIAALALGLSAAGTTWAHDCPDEPDDPTLLQMVGGTRGDCDPEEPPEPGVLELVAVRPAA